MRRLLAPCCGVALVAPAGAVPAEPASPGASWVQPGAAPAPAPAPPGPTVDPANHRLVVAGNVVTGLGVGAFIVMTAGFLVASDANDRLGYARAREDDDEIARQQGRLGAGRIMGISAAAAMTAMLVAGLTLIGVGRTRERKRREALETAWVPMLSPERAGLAWTLRF